MRYLILFAGVWGLLSTAVVFGAEVRKNSPELTVCSVSENPEHFSGKEITISAQLESDGIERTALTDGSCEDVGIAISAQTHFKGDSKFRRALEIGHPGTLDKRITGTFVGKFVWQPKVVSPKRVLVLKEARNISVVMK